MPGRPFLLGDVPFALLVGTALLLVGVLMLGLLD
jgi:hypothetical protein